VKTLDSGEVFNASAKSLPLPKLTKLAATNAATLDNALRLK
jgi:hypothetical protein